MNKERRKQLAKATQLIEQAKTIIETIKDEEQDSFDNLPEGLQEGERGQKMEENVSSLDDAITGCDEVLENINTATAQVS